MIGSGDTRPVPHDPNAEAALLGSILHGAEQDELPRGCVRVLDRLEADDFYVPDPRAVFGAAKALHLRGTRPAAALVRGHLLDHHVPCIGGEWGDVLLRFFDLVQGATNTLAYADVVVGKALQRDLIAHAADVDEQARNGRAPDEVLRAGMDRLAYLHAVHDEVAGTTEWPFTSLDALLAEPEPEVVHLWPGIVALGHLTLLAASPKAGKTWLTYAFLASLVRGEPWLGGKAPAKPLSFLVVSEESKSLVRAHLRRFGLTGPSEVITIDALPLGARWESTVEAAAKRAVQVGAQVLVFDTLSTLAGIEDENESASALRALRPCMVASRRHGLASLVIHHARKEPGEHGSAIRGHTSFQQVPDVLVEIRPFGPEGSSQRSLHVRTRLADEQIPAFVVERRPGTPNTYALVGTVSDAQDHAKDAAILKSLVEVNRFVPVSDLVAPGLSKRFLETALPRLYRQGHIQRITSPGKGGANLYAHLGVPLHSAGGQP